MGKLSAYLLSVLVSLLLGVVVSYAQSSKTEILQTALEYYRIGRFDEVLKILDERILRFEAADRLQAYRLRSLAAIAEDDVESASKDVAEILKIEPYYTASLQDPVAYSRLIREMQTGKLTLVTASQLAETLDEVPVPVTLITADMIKYSGVRTLNEALTWFVPGMTSVESSNEVNVSMRGVYSSSQQKILIMLDGHRLNSRSYNNANPDFSISLEKVKQIEVLRGPASSLYGNVALTAVVNIITKDGLDVDGMSVKAGAGSYGEVLADVLIGKRFMSMDFMAWGSIYRSDGQQVFVPASQMVGNYPHDGYAHIEGYNMKPSYDYGFTYQWNDVKLLFSQRYGKQVDPFVYIAEVNGETYDYNRYGTYEGELPGTSFTSTHADLSYSKTFGNFAFDISGYCDYSRNNLTSVIGDTSLVDQMSGVFQGFQWYEDTYGAIAKTGWQYKAGKAGTGNLIGGVQYEFMRVSDCGAFFGNNFNNVSVLTKGKDSFIRLDRESVLSLFVQEKHKFNEHWILNVGVRYDHKLRSNDKSEDAVSPRVSLIWLPSDRHSLKLSYSQSFVDAPYYYRNNITVSYRGSENLEPEKLKSVQINYSHIPMKSIRTDFNMYYNSLTDFIYKNPNRQSTEDPAYINAGKLNSIGFEAVANLTLPRLSAMLNFSWQRVISGENYSFRDQYVFNIPQFTSNLLVNGVVFDSKKGGKLSLRGNLLFQSKQLSPYSDINIGGVPSSDPDHTLPARAICHIGLLYKIYRFEISFQCNNLFNTKYYQGGTTIVPYIRPGRWISAYVSFKF